MALTGSYSVLLSSISFFPDGFLFDWEVLGGILLYFWRTLSLLGEESAFWGFTNLIVLQSQDEWLPLGLFTCVSGSALMDECRGSPEDGSLLLPLSCC